MGTAVTAAGEFEFLFARARVIGWDIAITPEGPILIEGNHNGSAT